MQRPLSRRESSPEEESREGIKEEGYANIKGYQIFHNYIRPHRGSEGKTPAEACGITVEGKNKWITLIQNANQKLTIQDNSDAFP